MAYLVSAAHFGVLWWCKRKHDRRVCASLLDLYDAEDALVGLHDTIVGLEFDVGVIRFYVQSVDTDLNTLHDEIIARFDREFVLPRHARLEFQGVPRSWAMDLCA